MALVPQPPAPLSPPRGGEPGAFWLAVAAVVLAIAAPIAALCREIAARWRGIVIAHLFFLTLWLAIQVFFFATGAYWCVPANGPKFIQWLMMSVPRIARCGPMPVPPLPLRRVVDVPVPPPEKPVVPPAVVAPAVAPPAVVPAAPPPAPVLPSESAAAPGTAVAPVVAPPAAVAPVTAPVVVAPVTAPAVVAPVIAPAVAAPPVAAPPMGTPLIAAPSAERWSATAIPNCWRDRAVGKGDCYRDGGAAAAAVVPPRAPVVPPRAPSSRRHSTVPAYPRWSPLYSSDYCRRRPWECWSDGYWSGGYF